MKQQFQQIGQTAIVIGGGIAGLCAARSLADYFARIVILERDALPVKVEPRKGVPQARHAHALLAGGRQALEKLFPELTQQLVTQGAVRGYGRLFAGGGYHYQIRYGPQGVFLSRPLLESEIRARLLTIPHIQLLEHCSVQGLMMNDERTRVTGVRLAQHQGFPVAGVLNADLVVDASGRGSRLPTWLERGGYPKPEIERVEVNMGYTSRCYRREPGHTKGSCVVNVAPTAENRRGGALIAQEHDRWIVTLAGYCDDDPPVDETGFLTFSLKLPTGDLYEIIRTATPLSDPVAFKFSANQRYHYEKLTRFPEGLLTFGDALCSFTPIYGQGMTVAALSALALQECLSGGVAQLARRFFQRVSKIVDIPWNITVGNDVRVTGASKISSPLQKFFAWYMDKLHLAARHDVTVAFAFRQVSNLLALPSSLLHPQIFVRVLWRSV